MGVVVFCTEGVGVTAGVVGVLEVVVGEDGDGAVVDEAGVEEAGAVCGEDGVGVEAADEDVPEGISAVAPADTFEERSDTAKSPTSEPAAILTYLLPVVLTLVICASPPLAFVPIRTVTVAPREIAEQGDVHDVG